MPRACDFRMSLDDNGPAGIFEDSSETDVKMPGWTLQVINDLRYVGRFSKT